MLIRKHEKLPLSGRFCSLFLEKTRITQIKSNQIKSNQTKSNQTKSNPIKSNQIMFCLTYWIACEYTICTKNTHYSQAQTQLPRTHCRKRYWQVLLLVSSNTVTHRLPPTCKTMLTNNVKLEFVHKTVY